MGDEEIFTVPVELYIKATSFEEALAIAAHMCDYLMEEHPDDQTGEPWLDSWSGAQ